MVLGIVLSYSRLIPYVETMLYTDRIPTAPPLEVAPAGTPEVSALLPFGNDVDEPDGGPPVATTTVAPTATLDPTATLTVMPTLTPPPTDTSAPPPTEVLTEVPTNDSAEPTEVPDTPEPTATLTATPTPTPEPTPTVSPTPVPTGVLPTNITIPDIDLDAPVVPIGWKVEVIGGQNQAIWDVPDWRAAGWHDTSAQIGVVGNTVLNGHNTSRGEVFRDLYKLEIGAEIMMEGEDGNTYLYRVEQIYILREAGQPLSVRLENARYIQDTPDERLTLVTCHPYGSLANRLVVIAYPVAEDTSQVRERMS